MLRKGEVAVGFTSNGAGVVERDLRGLGDAAESTGKRLDGVGAAAQRTGGQFENLSGLIKNTLGTISAGAIAQFVTRSIVDFQRLEAQVTTFTGSFQKTGELFEKFRADNARTGLNINESAQAWVTLRTQGIEPTAERMKAIGNISAFTGKTITDVANLFGQAARGQYRELTQLGAQFREENDQIVVTFTDGTKKIIRSVDDAFAAVERFGNVDLAGSKEREAATLAGAFGDLAQAATQLSVAVSKQSGLVDGLTDTLRLLTSITNIAGDTSEGVRKLAAEINALNALTARGPARLGNSVGNSIREFFGFGGDGTAGQGNSAGLLGAMFGGSPYAAFQARAALTGGFSTGASTAPGAGDRGQLVITRELDQATKDLIDTIYARAEAEGKSKVQQLELAKAQAVNSAATKEAKERIAAAYDAWIRATRATDAAASATKKNTDATKGGTQATGQNTDAVDRQREALARLVDELYGLDPALAQYRDQVAEIVALFQAGSIGADDFTRLLAKAQSNLADAARATTGTPDDYRNAGREQVDAYTAAWEDGLGELGGLITDLLGDAFGRAGENAAGIFIDYLRQSAQRANFRRTGNLALDSAQLGRGFELDPNFVGPPTASAANPAQAGAGNLNLGDTILQAAAQIAPQLGATLGGGGRNAQLGAQIGETLFGPIGGFLGGLLGGAFDNDPRITISGNARSQDQRGRTVFGEIGASTRNTNGLSGNAVIEAVQRVDAAIASLLTGGERTAVIGALRGFRATSEGDDASIEEVLARRVAVILQTVEPAFATFLNGITDVEERIRQFEGLRALKKLIDDIDGVVAESFGDPVEALGARIARLGDAVAEGRDALASAIDAQDFVQAAQAASTLQQAVVELATAQINAALELEQALFSLDQQSRAFAVNLAQRIASVTGGNLAGVIGVLNDNLATTRAAVGTARTPEQSLAYLNEFIATVDAWLQQSTAQVQRLLAEQLATLDEERDSILANAQIRADAAQQAAQAENDRNRALLDALQQQLALAQRWAGVVDRTQDLIDQLRFGAANPVGLQSQFANLGSEADALFAQFGSATGGNRVEIATRLLDILTQQQQVGASLFDRPSDESVALYNQILARINTVREVAQPEAERAAQLQQEIADLQRQTVGAVRALTDATYYLTAEERERLDQIEEERAAAQEAAQEALDAINAEAAEYYTWARTTGLALQQQQRDTLLAQLEELTNGVDIQQFIATTQRQARDALYAIRDDLRAFLESIRVVGAAVGPGGGGTGPNNPINPGDGSGGQGGGAGGSAVILNVGDIVVQGGGDPTDVANAVRKVLADDLPVLASRLKRELATA
jgi:hypothetical protein